MDKAVCPPRKSYNFAFIATLILLAALRNARAPRTISQHAIQVDRCFLSIWLTRTRTEAIVVLFGVCATAHGTVVDLLINDLSI